MSLYTKESNNLSPFFHYNIPLLYTVQTSYNSFYKWTKILTFLTEKWWWKVVYRISYFEIQSDWIGSNVNLLCWIHNLANAFDISDSISHPQLPLLYTMYEWTMYYGTKPYEPSRMLKMSKMSIMSIPKLFVGNHQNI